MKDFWNSRYSRDEYVYGTNPNMYLKERLSQFKQGKILFPAEGEGRNAVFAAKNGWEVSAFDISSEAKIKAERLAGEHQVEIDYQVGSLKDLDLPLEAYDVIVLIYAHVPREERDMFFTDLDALLKKGGSVIFEGFSKEHIKYQEINPAVGGPKDEKMLFSEAEIKAAFSNYDFQEFYEGEIELKEGEFHKGKGWVIRFIAKKR